MEDREKTKRALSRVDAGQSPYSAAIDEGIAPPTVYRALKRRQIKAEKAGQLKPCPCCQSLVRPEQIKHEVREPNAIYQVDRLQMLMTEMREATDDPSTDYWIERAKLLTRPNG